MNLNLQTNVCDPERLEAFLCGDLTGTQESEFSLHLGACENCRRALQERAAEPEAWQEAEKLLRPAEFDSELESQQPTQPLQIQQVVAALGPTDDPAMLGRLGGYEVSGVVGAGGMGVVLKAVDKSLDRTVAIKVLAPHLATSGAARKRFAREAKAAAAVLHPNVIAIHSVSNEQSLPYLVMPYVRGTSLQKRLDAEGPLSLQEILRIGAQVAAGLAAAHAQGLVHRDIKPANILLEEGVERVTITDFGLARAVDDASITHSGMIAGTPQYMSPEQARGEAVDGRSDLFSLGSVLYAICTGRPPFRAETSYGVLRRITDDEPTPIREINPEIPEWLCQIVSRLMSKSAAGRFTSAAEVGELFEKCLAHVQQPDSVVLPAFLIPPSKARHSSLSRRSLGVIAMIATFVSALLGIAGWQATEPPDIAGKWTGEGWGEVQLEQKEPGEYAGTYTDTFKQKPGTLELKWSRLEGRYKGTWQEGKDRQGKISVRLVEGEIRGAWTTSKKSDINPGNPELADLLWKRSSGVKEQPEKTQSQAAVKSDKELLQGTWKLLESHRDGKKMEASDKLLWPHELWIHDNEYTELFTINGKLSGGQSRGTLVLDQIQKPKQITIVSFGSERRGIYKREGDTLTICWAGVENGSDGKGAIRPDDFRTMAKRMLHVYQRAPAPLPLRIVAPEKMLVTEANYLGQFDNAPRHKVPVTLNLTPGETYRLKLSEIPGRPGLEMFPVLEVRGTNSQGTEDSKPRAIPLELTAEDLDLAAARGSGTFYKVAVVSKRTSELQILVSCRPDTLETAAQSGRILYILRIGNIDLEADKAAFKKDEVVGIRVRLLLNAETHSAELMDKNKGYCSLSIMGTGITGTAPNGKSANNLVAVMAHGCRLESFAETKSRGKKYWDAEFFVPQGPASDGSNRSLSQKMLDGLKEQGVEFQLDHYRDQVAQTPKSRDHDKELQSTSNNPPRAVGDQASNVIESLQVFDPNQPPVRHLLPIGNVSKVSSKQGQVEVSLMKPGSVKVGDVLELSRPNPLRPGSYTRFARVRVVESQKSDDAIIAVMTHSARQKVENRWEWRMPETGDFVCLLVLKSKTDPAEGPETIPEKRWIERLQGKIDDAPVYGQKQGDLQLGLQVNGDQRLVHPGDELKFAYVIKNSGKKRTQFEYAPLHPSGHTPRIRNEYGGLETITGVFPTFSRPTYSITLEPSEVHRIPYSVILGKRGEGTLLASWESPALGRYTLDGGLSLNVVSPDSLEKKVAAILTSGAVGFEVVPKSVEGELNAQPPAKAGGGPTPRLSGLVVELREQELVKISLGSDDGIRLKDILDVFRDKAYVGRITVQQVTPDQSVARIESREGEIHRGDQVVMAPKGMPPEAEIVMNLGFERNGLGFATSVSPVLLQKGQIVKASEFQAYLDKEKLALTHQHGDGATKTTTVRLYVDRNVQFDAVTALMKLCQKVGFQKFDLRLDDEAVEKFVLEILRTPFNFDESKGSWQDGAYETQILLSLNMVRPQDRVVKTLLKVVDRSEKGTMDQRRLAMMSLGGMAPQQVIPLLIKELEGAKDLPVGKFKESFPYHEIAVLEDIGEEAKDAIPILITLLDSQDGLACQSALLALVKIGPSSDEVMNAIAARFGKPDEPVWSRAVYEVGRYGKQAKPLGPTLVKLLGAKPKEARIWAAQALVTSGYDEARGFNELMKDVAAGESADRGLAATALAALGSQAKPMIPKLKAFENDADAHVAKEVRDAIRRIGKDDRIFTHAEEAAKTAASRKAAAEALKQISAETKAISSEAEYQRIEGTWRLVTHVVGSEVTLDEFGKDAIHDIRNRQMGDVRISLDPTKSPREIDLTFTNGPDKGKVLRGIYDWVIDARGKEFLAISVSPKLSGPGDDATHRPKDFGVRIAVDYALLERIVAKSPRGQVPQEPLGSANSGFSETKEVVLSMGSLQFMLDLDTGKTMDPPATIRPEQEQMDVQTDQVQPYHYPTKLIGRGLVGLEVKSSDWDASAVDVRRALTGKSVEPLKEMDLGPEKSPTYFFRTKGGTQGVLQLLGIVEEPKGIRLRYKTVPTEPMAKEKVVAESPPKSTSAAPNWARHLGTVEGLKSIAYSPDGKLIAAANGNVSFPVAEGWKRAVVVLEAETGKTVLTLPLATKDENAILAATEGLPHFEVGPLAFSPDGSLLAVGTGLGQVKLFNPKTAELVRSLDDEVAKLAEKKTPEKLKSLKRAMGGVGSLAFSPDGTLLVTTGSSFEDAARNWGDVRRLGRLATGPGRLKVWDVKTGALKHDLVGHSHATAAAFSADGSLLVSAGRGLSEGGNDNGVIVWNPQTGEKLRTIPFEANGGTQAVVFSPTKKLVAVASRTFDKENDTSSTSIRLLYPLSGITEWDRNFPGWASPKVFLPDGSGVGVLCGGDSIKFLSVETAADLFEIHPTDAKAKSSWIDFALAPQSRKLAIGGTDKEHIGSVEIWDLGHAAKPPAPLNDSRKE